jgi:hypothetical protein
MRGSILVNPRAEAAPCGRRASLQGELDMTNPTTPFHPIIYVRGFAMTQGEIDETAADPFCGFNLGSTVYRAVPDRKRPPRKYVFESPVIRLASDFKYRDVYEDGYDLLDPEWQRPGRVLGPRSIIVFRYYDQASQLFGEGKKPSIDDFARQLGDLIVKVHDLVVANEASGITTKDFRCYLVAHSMGGLVCRAFLQNVKNDPRNASRFVDKFFTYATPHNGIDVAGVNVPSWLSFGDTNNFNRERMAVYLGIEKQVLEKTGRVDWLPEERFPARRVFCMVGTNRQDYEAALGLSRTFVGHGSDGLVRIDNATLTGLKANGQPGEGCAKAFTYRAHSGPHGIVNSEEAYQNLTRFLFGNVRVDIFVDIDEVEVPPKLAAAAKADTLDALYQIELLASPRGKLWYLTRRVAEEDSVACFTQKEWNASKKGICKYLSTVFLARRARVDKEDPSLAYSVTFGVRVPDYEVERKLWFDEHYEGGYLFRDGLVIELVPPETADDAWTVRHAWQRQTVKAPHRKLDPKQLKNSRVEVTVPFDSDNSPGVKGQLRFVLSEWNEDAVLEE